MKFLESFGIGQHINVILINNKPVLALTSGYHTNTSRDG